MLKKRFSKDKSRKNRSTRKTNDEFHNTLLLMHVGGKVQSYQLKKTKKNFKKGGFDLNSLNPWHKPTIGEQVSHGVQSVNPMAEPTIYQKATKAVQSVNPWRERTLMEKYGYKNP